MASVEQVDAMMELMQQQMAQSQRQMEMLTALEEKRSATAGGGGRGNMPKEGDDADYKGKLNPKDYMGIEKLDSKERYDQWAWSMKYRVKAACKDFGKLLNKVETMSEKEMEDETVRLVGTESEMRSAELYGILSDRVDGEAMSQVRSIEEGDGLMAWRTLYISFNPRTLSGTMMKIIEAVRPAKVTDLAKLSGGILEWEKKFREAHEDVGKISDRGRTAILASMLPEDIYEVVIQNAEKGAATYQETKDKVVAMAASRIARNEFKVMEVGLASHGAVEAAGIDAIGMNTKCYSCQGFGHIASQCPKGKGKVGGKGGFGKGGAQAWSNGGVQGPGPKGDGKGAPGGKGKGQGKGIAGACWKCQKIGHRAVDCYASVNGVNEGTSWDDDSETREVDSVWFVGGIEKQNSDTKVSKFPVRLDANVSKFPVRLERKETTDAEGWKVRVSRGPLKKMKAQKDKASRYDDVERKFEEMNVMKNLKERSEMCAEEVFVKSDLDKRAIKEINVAEKKDETKCAMTFHVTDSKRMLAAVSRIMEADNTVVFSKRFGSYVENDKTGERMEIKKTRGVFHIDALIWDGQKMLESEIVIDSGAADNVMPRDILSGLELMAKDEGVRFQGANGAELGNYGKKKIRFLPSEWRNSSPF